MLARIVLLIFFVPEWIFTLWVFRSPRVRRWRADKNHPGQVMVIGLLGISVMTALGGVAVASALLHGVPRPFDRGLMSMFNIQQCAVACATLWMARSWIPENRLERRMALRRTLFMVAMFTLINGAGYAIGSGPHLSQWSPTTRAVVAVSLVLAAVLLLILVITDACDKHRQARSIR